MVDWFYLLVRLIKIESYALRNNQVVNFIHLYFISFQEDLGQLLYQFIKMELCSWQDLTFQMSLKMVLFQLLIFKLVLMYMISLFLECQILLDYHFRDSRKIYYM